MSIETIVVLIVVLVMPFLTEWRLKRMFKDMLENPETATKMAKILKRVLKEYKNVRLEEDAEKVPVSS